MATQKLSMNFAALFSSAAILLCALSLSSPASAQTPSGPVAQQPYVLTVFANSTTAYSQPDSIVQWRDRILIRSKKDDLRGSKNRLLAASSRDR